jgi:hypothetical protein
VRTFAAAVTAAAVLAGAVVGGGAAGPDTVVAPHRAAGSAVAGAMDNASLPAAGQLLARAVDASQTVAHRGRVTIVSFGERGPQVTELAVERAADEVRVEQLEGSQLGHEGTHGGTRATERLLRVAGLGDAPDPLGLLDTKYRVGQRGTVATDTGAAVVVELVERGTGVLRELLYLDTTTGLVVRRETFDRGGAPVRVVAYVSLDTTPPATLVAADAAEAGDVEDDPARVKAVPQPAGAPPRGELAARLRDAGFAVPEELGAGYRLLAAAELALDPYDGPSPDPDDPPAGEQPAVHLLYGDGLYTLSLFQQQGRLAPVGRRDAVALSPDHGGTVWRWPGSEPRHMVWTGDGVTFTALTDAPADELLAAIDGLPIDPPPSVLDRLTRGLQRVGRWLAPGDDDPEGA